MTEQDFMRILGSNIRAARTRNRLSQTDLAKAIGRSVASVSKYERGDCAIDSYTLCNIARVLSVTAFQLLPEERNDPSEIYSDGSWNTIMNHNRLYLHNMGSVSKKLNCSLIDIDWRENKAVMYVDIYGQLNDENRLLSDTVLYGNAYSTSACTTILVSNPVAPIDYFHIVINSGDWYSGRQVCYISYTTINWRCATSKGILTITPEHPANIEELLVFTKDELKDIKKNNRLLL